MLFRIGNATIFYQKTKLSLGKIFTKIKVSVPQMTTTTKILFKLSKNKNLVTNRKFFIIILKKRFF